MEIQSCIRGFHVYKGVLTPIMEKKIVYAPAVFPPKINSRVGEIYKLLCFKFHTMKICSIKIKFLIYNKKKGWCSATLPPFGENTVLQRKHKSS